MKIKQLIKISIAAFAMVGLVGLMNAQPVAAANTGTGATGALTDIQNTQSFGGQTDLSTTIKTAINLLLYVIGILAVVMLIVGGFKYTTSSGDPGKVDEAKKTILYAVIGLIVAILAFAIVNFVATQFGVGV